LQQRRHFAAFSVCCRGSPRGAPPPFRQHAHPLPRCCFSGPLGKSIFVFRVLHLGTS
jgi:hypothetical protein